MGDMIPTFLSGFQNIGGAVENIALANWWERPEPKVFPEPIYLSRLSR
jgi:hypothetical protein